MVSVVTADVQVVEARPVHPQVDRLPGRGAGGPLQRGQVSHPALRFTGVRVGESADALGALERVVRAMEGGGL